MGQRARRGASASLVAVCTALALAGSSARAGAEPDKNPDLAAARVHITALELDLAQASLDEALRTGDNDPQTTATIHGLVGLVAGSREQPKEAQAAFERQLAIDPAATVDTELGPKIVVPFTAARTALAGRRIEVRAEQAANGTITLVIGSDPRSMVLGARGVYRTPGGSENVVTARGTGRLQLSVPVDGTRDVIVSAVDVYGNRLVDLAVVAHARASTTTPGTAGGTSERSRAWLWVGGGALAATATGTVFALLARSTRSEISDGRMHPVDHSYTELQGLDDQGARRTLIANIAFGAGVACAITAGVLYVVGTRDSTDSAVTATAVPVTGGAAIQVGGAF